LREEPAAVHGIERLLIVRLSAMGDVIHALPAAQALRAEFPEATIGWLIEERWAELLCAAGTARRGPRSAGRPLVDWVHTVRLREWRKSLLTMASVQQIAKVWNDVRSVGYEVALDLQGAIRSAVLASWSGAGAVYGAALPREAPASLWYTRQTIARGAHVVEQGLSLAEGVAQRKLAVPWVEFPHDGAAEQFAENVVKRMAGADFALLNPGAGWGAKRWPAERYGRVTKELARDGVRSVVNYGPGEEELAREVEETSEGAARALRCSISELIALTRRARVFVGGDTGPMHLAAALRVPVVGIFGPTDPARNGPYGTRSVVLRNPASETTHARRAQPDDGLLEIGVDAVVKAVRGLLALEDGVRG
jgi:heptosyltransferase I